MSHIVVIGAGPAGLMAALRAAENGHAVTVFEASPHVGGMAGSFEVAGQRVDYGSHRLHPATDPALLSRIARLLGPDLQTRRRNGRIRLRERWVGFPLTPAGIISQLPPSFGLRAARDAVTRPLRRGDRTSFDGTIRHRLGPTVAEEFYAPYARKLYGVPATELTSELADRRVAASSPLAVLRSTLRARRPDGRVFFYPRNGYGQITDALADAAIAAGVELRLSHPVRRVDTGGRLRIEAGSIETEADLICSTMPIDALIRALTPDPPAEVNEAVGRMRHRAMVLVYLVVPRPRYTEFDAHYLPDDALGVSRLSEPKNYRDGDDPPDRTVLCAEVPCWPDDEIWNAAPDELAELVEHDLRAVGLPPTHRVATEVRRLRHVYPVYDHAGEPHRHTVAAWRPDPRVITFGRQGLGVPDNIHHVLAMGVRAAEVVAEDGIDDAAWQRALRDFTHHVVQD